MGGGTVSETTGERRILAEQAKAGEAVHAARAYRVPLAARVLPVLRYVAIFLVTLTFVFPFLWMILASFKTQTDIMNTRNIFSFNPTSVNYENVFNQYSFLRFMINSFVVAMVSTILSLILGLPAAYAIARFRMNGFGLVLLAARIVPGITFLIPWYILFSQVKWVGSYQVLILSHMLVGLPFVAWVMISFFEGLPVELEEAGMVDGLTPIGAFFRIALPLSTPGIITGSILSFIFSWNNFMFSYILAGQDTRTLPVAIFGFISYASIDWGGLMAAAVVITIPVLIITLFVQRYVISGLTAGATKG
jgi:multiple sugar transport system permease protein